MSEGKWRLYYAGRQQQQGPWDGVGVALGGPGAGAAAGGVVLSFKRRTGKKKKQAEQQQPSELQ
jgi:hypothetical protein